MSDYLKTLLLCPLKLEQTLILERLVSKGCVPQEISVGREKAILLKEQNLILAVAGHGKTQFGIQTQYFLHHLNEVERVFCVGCAGAIQEDLKIGSVIVATETVEHDFQIKFVSRPLPRFPGDRKLLEEMRDVALKEDMTNVLFGRVASGDEDIVERVRAQEISKFTQALAVAWEGAGGARACLYNQIPYLEIRGVSDHADQIEMDFAQALKQAMAPVADLIHAWASRATASQNRTSNL